VTVIVTASEITGDAIGGFIGDNTGIISNSFTSSNVVVNGAVGNVGNFGGNENSQRGVVGNTTNSTATGTITQLALGVGDAVPSQSGYGASFNANPASLSIPADQHSAARPGREPATVQRPAGRNARSQAQALTQQATPSKTPLYRRR